MLNTFAKSSKMGSVCSFFSLPLTRSVLGVTRSTGETMLWVGEDLMFREMTNVSTVDDVFTHLTEDGGEGDGWLFDPQICYLSLNIGMISAFSKKKVYGPGPVKPAWRELLLGLLLLFILLIKMVHLQGLLFCETLLRRQVKLGQYALSPHYHSLGLYWVSQDLLEKPCCESVRMSCSER